MKKDGYIEDQSNSKTHMIALILLVIAVVIASLMVSKIINKWSPQNVVAIPTGAMATPTEVVVTPTIQIPKPEITQTLEPVKTPTPDVTNEPNATNGALKGVVIGLDPGHQLKGNHDLEALAPDSTETKAKVASGTQGITTGMPEFELNLLIALEFKELLESKGAHVVMTRTENEVDISNKERAVMMNEAKVDVCLRLHCDGSDDSDVSGIGMFIRETGDMAEVSADIAQTLLDKMAEATGAIPKGVYKSDNYTGLNWSTVPSVLVEMGYMSNSNEDVLLSEPEYQQKLMNGMLNGLVTYFTNTKKGVPD